MGQGIDLIETRKYEDGFVGASERKSVFITIATGQNLKAFCPIGRKDADGLYYKWNDEGTDGTQTMRGILMFDADATTAAVKAEMCVVGEFDADFVSAALGETMIPESYNFGNIILRKVAN